MNGEIFMNEMKHGEFYTCKRLRMLSWLKEHGRLPIQTLPDAQNPSFNVWVFKNDAELESLIAEYFEQLKD